jgi:hypothetical protein
MILISPRAVLATVARQVPAECRQHLIVIGSLAAAYQLFAETDETPVRTKDVDCILVPRIEAVRKGAAVAEALLAAGWRPPAQGPYSAPGTAETPDDRLPVVRLYPPDSVDWFIELLTVQDAADERDRAFERVVLSDGGHYAVASFRYLDVAAHRALETAEGIRCARLEMLALSNLLRNPVVSKDRMQTPGGPGPKRSNKDLGRVLTIARLAGRAAVAEWPAVWAEALRAHHPDEWRELAGRVGAGIRALVANEGDLREALEVSRSGLLASFPTSADEFRAVAERLLLDAVEPLQDAARAADGGLT